jgi:hypothetical protein
MVRFHKFVGQKPKIIHCLLVVNAKFNLRAFPARPFTFLVPFIFVVQLLFVFLVDLVAKSLLPRHIRHIRLEDQPRLALREVEYHLGEVAVCLWVDL